MFKVYVNSEVDNKMIRKEMYNGREHYVVPSYTLPFGVVMNDIYYSEEQIVNNYQGLENTFAPVGHPQDESGKYIPASHPISVNKYHIGAWNRNVKLDGQRVYVEKWIDIDLAKKSQNGQRVLDHIEAGRPISTSVAVNLKKIPSGKNEYGFVANIQESNPFDHDAILLDEEPACSIEQGTGMMVNTKDAVTLETVSLDVNQSDDSIIKSMYNLFKSIVSNDKSLIVNKKEGSDMEFNDKQIEQIGAIVANALTASKEAEKKEQEKLQVNQEVEKLKAENEALKAKLQANENEDDRIMREEVKRLTGMSDEQVAKLDRQMLERIIGTRRDIDDEFTPNSAQSFQGGFTPLDQFFKKDGK